MEANYSCNDNKPNFVFWLILGLILALIVLNGCKPLQTTVYVDRIQVRDSIAYDSVYIEKTDTFMKEIKGDSVFITKIKYQDKYKIKFRNVAVKDTIRQTIEKPVIKIKEVKVRDWIWWAGMAGVLFLLYKIIRFFARFLK